MSGTPPSPPTMNNPAAMLRRNEPLVPDGVLGMLLFVGVEVMFFAALISAYLIVRAGAPDWPPAGQPRLPVSATAFNTFLLLLSGVFVYLANGAFERGRNARTLRLLSAAILFGAAFVLLQGREWVRLVHFGLTMRSSNYGSFFYLIVGAHGLHALAAILLLARVYAALRAGPWTADLFRSAQVFWYFVVGVWPFLYVLVYLS